MKVKALTGLRNLKIVKLKRTTREYIFNLKDSSALVSNFFRQIVFFQFL